MDLFEPEMYYDFNDPEQLEKIRQESDVPTVLMTIILTILLIMYATCTQFDKVD